MAQDSLKRKLITILNNDVPSYSRLKTGGFWNTATFRTRGIFRYMPLIFGVGIALLFLWFMGCASRSELKLLHSPEKDIVKNQKSSVFLFRILVFIDGKPINMFEEFKDNHIQIYIGNIDKKSSVKKIATLYSNVEERGKEGWFYLLLEPAVYYMQISSIWHAKLDPILFYIPSGSSLVYGGSFLFSCKGGLNTNFECFNIQVEDETAIAERIAGSYFQEHLPIAPFIADIFTNSPVKLLKNELIPMGILTSVNSEFELPSWRKSVWSRATGIPDWWTDRESIPSAMKYYLQGWGAVGYGPPGALTGYIFYLSVALPYAAVTGEVSQFWWKSCMQRHMEEFSKSDLTKELFVTIQEEFHSILAKNSGDETTNVQAIKSLLEVNILHIGLKECQEKGTFCPEISFSVKLWNLSYKKIIYNKVFIFSNHTNRTDFIKPYFSFISGAGCREMDSYCGDNTRSVFRQEISNSIKELVWTVKKEIGSLKN